VLCAGAGRAADPPPAAKPAAAKPVPPEALSYVINWPTGLSLGEARLTTVRRDTEDGPRIETTFHLDASVPGFPVIEDHRSMATGPGFCSVEFDKKYTHGKRTADETLKFDQQATKVTRETKDGGTSDIPASSCAKDALAFIGFIRSELAAGRLPAPQSVYYGAGYQVRLVFGGTQKVKIGSASVDADRIQTTLKGPKADISFDVFFEKDKARTPVLVKVPLALATFSMELVRP
jgi:hypothetical protein